MTSTNSGEPTYIFKGNNASATDLDNNLVFAGFSWRIYRINEDGTIRAIMDSGINDGTKYAFAEATGFTYKTSTAKQLLDTWYNENLSSYSSYLETGDYFCSKPYNSTLDPSLLCDSTYIESGNIGLPTKHELVNTGITTDSKTGHYLNSSDNTWTMSILNNNSIAVLRASAYFVGNTYSASNLNSYRPVIILKDTSNFSGDGTTLNPYEIPKNTNSSVTDNNGYTQEECSYTGC